MSSYHGWTHAPKAQGGTDPIPGLSGPTWIRRKRGSTTQSVAGNSSQVVITYETAYDINDYPSDFDTALAGGSEGGIEVLRDGLYSILCRVFCGSLDSEFTINLWGIDPDSWAPYGASHTDLQVSTELSGMAQAIVRLEAGQIVFATIRQDSGSSKTIDVGTFLEVVRLGDVTTNNRNADGT